MEKLGIAPGTEGAVAELARFTGIESRYLYRWHAGQTRPSFDEAIRLLDVAALLQPDVRERLEHPRAPQRGAASARSQAPDLRGELEAIRRRLRELERLL